MIKESTKGKGEQLKPVSDSSAAAMAGFAETSTNSETVAGKGVGSGCLNNFVCPVAVGRILMC